MSDAMISAWYARVSSSTTDVADRRRHLGLAAAACGSSQAVTTPPHATRAVRHAAQGPEQPEAWS